MDGSAFSATAERSPVNDLVATVSSWKSAADPIDAALPIMRSSRLLESPFYLSPTSPAGGRHFLEILRDIGRCDLSLGRVFEGHANAIQLTQLYGTAAQVGEARSKVAGGGLLGVWNTDGHSPVRLCPTSDGRFAMSGSKRFCSGALHVELALVTADFDNKDRLMCLVPVCAPVAIDCSGWRPLGMIESASGTVEFDGVILTSGQILGGPGDYERQPWFSGGAVRFAAVQLGGAEALLEVTVKHLAATGRTEDPYQVARVGALATAIESGRAWLARGAEISARAADPASTAIVIRHADMMRTAIERICLDALEYATRSVGLAGLMSEHPISRIVRDLTTYLRQPNPDGALAAVGRYVLATPGATDSDHFDG